MVTLSLMDATYKTSKYELALFFLAVRNIAEYSVVGEFIVQLETAEQITEEECVLRMLNSLIFIIITILIISIIKFC